VGKLSLQNKCQSLSSACCVMLTIFHIVGTTFVWLQQYAAWWVGQSGGNPTGASYGGFTCLEQSECG
jgi:hypothetical protein